jgi:hypothetical protein
MPLRVLMIGDVVGRSGLDAVAARLPALRRASGAGFVIANGENASGGFGLDRESLAILADSGVDVVSSGNHVWQKRELFDIPRESLPIPFLRPANYPEGSPGRGSIIAEAGGFGLIVLNLQGRRALHPIDCPFRAAEAAASLAAERGLALVVDFHAETNDEKQAMAWHLRGKAAALAGTHTHVQTADLRVLPGGLGYVSDLGMTGPAASCIGVPPELAIRRARTGIPLKMEAATGQANVSGVCFELDGDPARCVAAAYVDASGEGLEWVALA